MSETITKTVEGKNGAVEISFYSYSGEVVSSEENFAAVNENNFEVVERGHYEINGEWRPNTVFRVGDGYIMKVSSTWLGEGFLKVV